MTEERAKEFLDDYERAVEDRILASANGNATLAANITKGIDGFRKVLVLAIVAHTPGRDPK